MVLTTTGDVSAGGWVPNPESGEVYVLDKVTGTTTKEQVTYTKVAGGLKNPMGIQIIDGRWYVSERDGPHRAAAGRRRRRHPDGAQARSLRGPTAATSTSSPSASSTTTTTSTSPARSPSTTAARRPTRSRARRRAPRSRSTAATWQVSTVAGGLRTPNGIGFGPEGGIFVNDNQGAWLPANKMVQIKQDRFFNHFTNPAGPFDTKPVTQPVLWMPHNEIANSPSEPGAAHRRSVQGPDALGRRHLRRPAARLPREGRRRVPGRGLPSLGRPRGRRQPHGDRARRRDLRRRHRRGRQLGRGQQAPLRPPEAHAERQQRLRHGEDGGHRGRLQDHLHAAASATRRVAKLKDAYKFKQWRYVPTSQYGGPKVDEESLLVTDAAISADKKTVTIHVDGLKPGRVVHVRSQRPFASTTGEELWNTEAWYTLNSLPGYKAPADDGLLRGRGGQAGRRRAASRPSTAATPAPASSAASATPART